MQLEMPDRNVTTCSPETATKPLTKEDLEKMFELIIKRNQLNEEVGYDKLIISRKALDKLIELGLKYDEFSPIIISSWIPNNLAIGLLNGKVNKIMRLDI